MILELEYDCKCANATHIHTLLSCDFLKKHVKVLFIVHIFLYIFFCKLIIFQLNLLNKYKYLYKAN